MNTNLFPDSLSKAAAAFIDESCEITPVGRGLINHTFLVKSYQQKPILLQQINTTVFSRPFDIQHNYQMLRSFLQEENFFLPALQKTKTGEILWLDENQEAWRAFEYIENSYSPDLVQNKEECLAVAKCFGRFTTTLKSFPAQELKTILPHFHNLHFRYQQFKDAIITTSLAISGELQEILQELEKRKNLVDLYLTFRDERFFPLHVMHHDCKISNLLFSTDTNQVICPVDLDTAMPGKFFSDLGDMIRTICCSVDENNTNWNEISIKKDFYYAIVEEYSSVVCTLFTKAEIEHLHYSGLLLLYMQSLRFLTDYLNGNVYYKVQHKEQNLHRAKNQLILLKDLEALLVKENLLSGYKLSEK